MRESKKFFGLITHFASKMFENEDSPLRTLSNTNISIWCTLFFIEIFSTFSISSVSVQCIYHLLFNLKRSLEICSKKRQAGTKFHFMDSTLCDPTDCGSLVSSVHGIIQVRTLEWVPFPFLGDLPNPGIEHGFPSL